MRIKDRALFVLLVFIVVGTVPPSQAQNGDAVAIMEEVAEAMGGLRALRAVNNQLLEVTGQQFEPEQAMRPGGESRHVSDFRYTLTREVAAPRMRLDWEGRRFYPRDDAVRFLEIIDGEVGLLRETVEGDTLAAIRMHPSRHASRLREQMREPAMLILAALEETSLAQLEDQDVDNRRQHVLAFEEWGNTFHVFIDLETSLVTQVDILEHDTIYGDSRFTLRYADWQSVDGIMLPFDRRYEINGRLLQTERVESVSHNLDLEPDTFFVPDTIRREEAEGEPIASQWILRRLAMNVSYLDFGRDIPVMFVPLADGITHLRGTSHNSVLVEFQDYLVVVEAPLYEERSENVIAAIRQRFPNKPIRYVIPTHFHNDHSGGMRTYLAEGVTVIAPAVSADHYEAIAGAQSTIRSGGLEQSSNLGEVEAITEPRILTDGDKRVEIYPYATSHADDYLLIYLPHEKFLIEGDHVSPRGGGNVRPGTLPRELLAGIEELQLEVETIVGIHGDLGTFEALRQAVQGPAR